MVNLMEQSAVYLFQKQMEEIIYVLLMKPPITIFQFGTGKKVIEGQSLRKLR